jgi:hypothetical protein
VLSRSPIVIVIALAALAALAATAAESPAKKPLFPPPEQSSTVGVLGAHRSNGNGATPRGEPPPPVAAPEIPKVDAEAPVALPASPRETVVGERPAVGAFPAPALSGPPNQYLVGHPYVTGLLAGLVGSALGARIYGGAMMGDQNGVLLGYGLRVALILAAAGLLFRFVSHRAIGGHSAPVASLPAQRSDPMFGAAPETLPDGRREPTIGQPEQE